MFGPLLRREASSKCLVCNLVSSSFRGLETALHGWATSNSFKHHVSVPTHNRSNNRIWTTGRLVDCDWFFWNILAGSCVVHGATGLCCSPPHVVTLTLVRSPPAISVGSSEGGTTNVLTCFCFLITNYNIKSTCVWFPCVFSYLHTKNTIYVQCVFPYLHRTYHNTIFSQRSKPPFFVVDIQQCIGWIFPRRISLGIGCHETDPAKSTEHSTMTVIVFFAYFLCTRFGWYIQWTFRQRADQPIHGAFHTWGYHKMDGFGGFIMESPI